jgi:hypothetical protein
LIVCSGSKDGNKSKLNKLDAHAKSNLHLTCMVNGQLIRKQKKLVVLFSKISAFIDG